MTSRIGSDMLHAAGHRLQAAMREQSQKGLEKSACFLRCLSLQREACSMKRAFTLVEAMAAAAVLSLGVVLLFHSFFSSLDAVQYASNRIFARIWLQGKIAQERENVILLGEVVPGSEAASFILEGRTFSWHRTLQSLDTDLYMLSLTLSWKEAGRIRTLSYTTYLNNP